MNTLPKLSAMQFNFANIIMEIQMVEDGTARMVFTPVADTAVEVVMPTESEAPAAPAAPVAPAAPAAPVAPAAPIQAQVMTAPVQTPPSDPTAAAAAFLAGNNVVPPKPTQEQTDAALAAAVAVLNS